MNKWILIGIGAVILACVGFFFASMITGSVITGGAILDSEYELDNVAPVPTTPIDNDKVVENEYFRISEFGEKVDGGN